MNRHDISHVEIYKEESRCYISLQFCSNLSQALKLWFSEGHPLESSQIDRHFRFGQTCLYDPQSCVILTVQYEVLKGKTIAFEILEMWQFVGGKQPREMIL